MEAKKTKVYIYTRVSTDMQVDGYSLDAQRDKLKKYADYNDMVIVGEYSDEGKSGKNIAGRPDFQRMLNDIACKKDDVKFVLVFKLSRFGRNTADTLNSLQYIQDFGVNLISTEDKIDSSEGTGKLMISVLSAVAEIERENILVQTMAGRKQKAREGKWNGGFAPYGYKLNKETSILEIAEDEAEAIRIIFDKFVHTDMGYNGVVTYLNNNGIKKKARQNGHLTSFTTSTVKAILDNPVYAGKIAYERRKNTKIEGTRNEYHIVPQKEYPVYDGKHEAIIDVKLWQDAQAKRKATAKRLEKKHGIDHEHVLSGIIKCPVCGVGMYGNRKTAKKKDGTYYPTYYSYACKHRAYKNGHKCDYHKQWNESKVDDAVAEIIKKLVQNPRFSEVMKTKINTKVDTAEAERELENARKMLRQAEGVKDRIILQLDSLDVLDKNYDRKYDDMQKRLDSSYEKISEAEELISICEDKLYNIQKDKITSTNIYNYLVMFESIYDDLTDMEKKQFYNTLLHEVQVFEEEQENGQIIKSMRFKFPVYYNGEFTDTIFRDKKETVETVVLLSQRKADDYVEVELELDELDVTSAESKATYVEIKDYVFKTHGLKVSNLYISQVKRKCGIEVGENYNLPKSEDSRQPQCPEEKEKAIRDALEHFGMA